MTCNQVFPSQAGCDDVRGEVIGDMSFWYSAQLQTVQTWPSHNHSQTWPARTHVFSSTCPNAADALAEYLAKNRREEVLGDLSPCVTELRAPVHVGNADT